MQTRVHYDPGQQISSSSASIGSGRSSGFVIRLAETSDPNELPYALSLTDIGQ